MTGSPEINPSNEKPETPDNSPFRVPSDDVLSGEDISRAPLSKEYLLAGDVERLSTVIERVVGDTDLLNEFTDISLSLCEGSSEEIREFSDRLCQAIATSFGKYDENRISDEYKSLLKLSSITEFFLDVLESKAADQIPDSLNQLLHACALVVRKLALDRSLFACAEGSDPAHLKELTWSSIAWGHVYVQNLDHIAQGLEMGRARQSPELVDEVKQLIQMQFDWAREGFGPVQSNHEGIISIWEKTFLLADRLADPRFTDSILPVAEEFLERSLSEEPYLEVSEFDSDEDVNFKLRIAESLELCECAALFALANCQDSLRPASLWQRILDEGSFLSGRWCLALLALADLDVTETPPHLVRLLNQLGRKSAMQSDSPALRDLMCNELMQYLNKPGAGNILLNVFDTNEEFCVKPARHERLLSLFHEMLDQPPKTWSAVAVKRLKSVLDDLESA